MIILRLVPHTSQHVKKISSYRFQNLLIFLFPKKLYFIWFILQRCVRFIDNFWSSTALSKPILNPNTNPLIKKNVFWLINIFLFERFHFLAFHMLDTICSLYHDFGCTDLSTYKINFSRFFFSKMQLNYILSDSFHNFECKDHNIKGYPHLRHR